MTTMPKTMMVKRAMVMTIARETRTPPMGTKREKAGSLSSTQYIHSSDSCFEPATANPISCRTQ